MFGNDCYIDNVVVSYDVPQLYKVSSADTGFTIGHPYTSGNATEFTIQSGDILTEGVTYYWRVRALDPLGRNTFGSWIEVRSYTPNTGIKTWDGDSWSYRPAWVWDGSDWVKKPIKSWDGNEWVIHG